jgi:hypothetical protein
MANPILRKDATGVKFDATIKERGVAVDLSSVSVKNYYITKPNGVVLTKAASFINTGTDGQLRYISGAGDLDTIGLYRWQVALSFPGGYVGPTDIGAFWVEANLL